MKTGNYVPEPEAGLIRRLTSTTIVLVMFTLVGLLFSAKQPVAKPIDMKVEPTTTITARPSS